MDLCSFEGSKVLIDLRHIVELFYAVEKQISVSINTLEVLKSIFSAISYLDSYEEEIDPIMMDLAYYTDDGIIGDQCFCTEADISLFRQICKDVANMLVSQLSTSGYYEGDYLPFRFKGLYKTNTGILFEIDDNYDVNYCS